MAEQRFETAVVHFRKLNNVNSVAHSSLFPKKREIERREHAKAEKYQKKKSAGCANFDMHTKDTTTKKPQRKSKYNFFKKNPIFIHSFGLWCDCNFLPLWFLFSPFFPISTGHMALLQVCVCNTIFCANIMWKCIKNICVANATLPQPSRSVCCCCHCCWWWWTFDFMFGPSLPSFAFEKYVFNANVQTDK